MYLSMNVCINLSTYEYLEIWLGSNGRRIFELVSNEKSCCDLVPLLAVHFHLKTHIQMYSYVSFV